MAGTSGYTALNGATIYGCLSVFFTSFRIAPISPSSPTVTSFTRRERPSRHTLTPFSESITFILFLSLSLFLRYWYVSFAISPITFIFAVIEYADISSRSSFSTRIIIQSFTAVIIVISSRHFIELSLFFIYQRNSFFVYIFAESFMTFQDYYIWARDTIHISLYIFKRDTLIKSHMTYDRYAEMVIYYAITLADIAIDADTYIFHYRCRRHQASFRALRDFMLTRQWYGSATRPSCCRRFIRHGYARKYAATLRHLLYHTT